jgi:hypothetical protein
LIYGFGVSYISGMEWKGREGKSPVRTLKEGNQKLLN